MAAAITVGTTHRVDEKFDCGPDLLAELILAGALPPEDLWPARGAAQLFSTIARIGATGAWRELARAAVRDGWNAGPG